MFHFVCDYEKCQVCDFKCQYHWLAFSCFGFSDSWSVLRNLLPGRGNHKLQSLLAEYCPLSSLSAHNALDDSSALHTVLHRVLSQHSNAININDNLWNKLMEAYFTVESAEGRVLSKARI